MLYLYYILLTINYGIGYMIPSVTATLDITNIILVVGVYLTTLQGVLVFETWLSWKITKEYVDEHHPTTTKQQRVGLLNRSHVKIGYLIYDKVDLFSISTFVVIYVWTTRELPALWVNLLAMVVFLVMPSIALYNRSLIATLLKLRLFDAMRLIERIDGCRVYLTARSANSIHLTILQAIIKLVLAMGLLICLYYTHTVINQLPDVEQVVHYGYVVSLYWSVAGLVAVAYSKLEYSNNK